MTLPPPRSPLFPYTTLFRSGRVDDRAGDTRRAVDAVGADAGQRHLRRRGHRVGNGEGKLEITSDRKSTRLNSSHLVISYAVFCLKKKKKKTIHTQHSR